MEYLIDIQIRNIYTKPESGLVGVFSLGDQVFKLLKELTDQNKIKGAYFSHYYNPPNTSPHVKVGIWYKELTEVSTVNQLLDNLCEKKKYKNIVADKGIFEPTTGKWENFPDDIVVDYVICKSFEFLVKAKSDLGSCLPPLDMLASWLMQHKAEVDQVIMSKDIFRAPQKVRTLTSEESGWVWERIVHHLLNAYCTYNQNNPIESYEFKLKAKLRRNGIYIP